MAKDNEKALAPILEFLIDSWDPHGWSWKKGGANPALWARILGPEGMVRLPGFEDLEGSDLKLDPEKGYRLGNIGQIWSFLNRGLPLAVEQGVLPSDVSGIEYRGRVPLATEEDEASDLASMEKNIRDLAALMRQGNLYGKMANGEKYSEIANNFDKYHSVKELLNDLRREGLYMSSGNDWKGGGDYAFDAFLKEPNKLGTWLPPGLGADPNLRREIVERWLHENGAAARTAQEYLDLLGNLKNTADDVAARGSREEHLGKVLADAMQRKDLNLLFGPRVPGGQHGIHGSREAVFDNNMATKLGRLVPGVEGVNKRYPRYRIDLLDLNSPFWKTADASPGVESSVVNDEFKRRMAGLLDRSVTYKDDRGTSHRSVSPDDLLAMGDPYLSEALGFVHGTKKRAFSGLLDMSPEFKGKYDAYEAGKKAEKEAKEKAKKAADKLYKETAYDAATDEEEAALGKAHEESAKKASRLNKGGVSKGGTVVIRNTGDGSARTQNVHRGMHNYANFVKNMLTDQYPGTEDEKKKRYNRLSQNTQKYGTVITTPEFKDALYHPEIRDIYFSGKASGLSPDSIANELFTSAINLMNKDKGDVSDERMKNIVGAILSMRGPGE